MSKPKRTAKTPAPDLHYIAEELRQFAVPIDSLELDPDNARAHGDENRATVAASLRERGQTLPITVRKANRWIMTGNCTAEEMRALGHTHVAALFLDYTEEQAIAWAIVHNRSAELAVWDYQQLAATINEHPDVDWEAAGFDADELEGILAAASEQPGTTTVSEHEREGDGETDEGEDEIPEPPAEPITKPGEVVELGPHVLHCCDCMDLLRSLPDNSIDAIVTHDVSKAIDAMHRADREVVSRKKTRWTNTGRGANTYSLDGFETDESGYEYREVTAPATEDAKRWSGWGTALKPAIEPAVLARKPLSEPTVAANVLRWGTGALNIDACRYGLGDPAWPGPTGEVSSMPYPVKGNRIYGDLGYREGEIWPRSWPSRFPANIYACPKPAGSERAAGTEHLPQEEKAQLAGAVNSDDPVSARFLSQPTGNTHPTVKPRKLYAWLLRLVTPPGGTVLEPFGGSGTTLVAATREGFKVIAAEREPKYCDIIRARVGHAISGQ